MNIKSKQQQKGLMIKYDQILFWKKKEILVINEVFVIVVLIAFEACILVYSKKITRFTVVTLDYCDH